MASGAAQRAATAMRRSTLPAARRARATQSPRENGRGGKKRREPVALYPVVQRMQQKIGGGRDDRRDQQPPRFVGRAGRIGLRQETAATAATRGANDQRVHQKDLGDDELATKNGVKPLAAALPPCSRKSPSRVRRSTGTNGRKSPPRAQAPPRRVGETSQRRSDGVVRQAMQAPTTKKAAVNFDRSMQPTATPIAISHPAFPGRHNSTSAASPASRKGRAARPASRTLRPR